jgi:hypothetical protein
MQEPYSSREAACRYGNLHTQIVNLHEATIFLIGLVMSLHSQESSFNSVCKREVCSKPLASSRADT